MTGYGREGKPPQAKEEEEMDLEQEMEVMYTESYREGTVSDDSD